jgi:hypothetical protein
MEGPEGPSWNNSIKVTASANGGDKNGNGTTIYVGNLDCCMTWLKRHDKF